MINYKIIYDISVTLGEESANWPDVPPYSREAIASIKNGDIMDVAKLTMLEHSGTHVDAPAHFIVGGATIDEYPISRWILPAQVVAIADKESIGTSEVEHLEIRDGDAILFKTYNSTSGRCISRVFFKDFVYLSPEAADFLVRKKVSLVGIDYNSINKYDDKDNLTHHKLLSNGILILETINLKAVPPGQYTLICAPLKLKDAGGAPTRAMLIS